MQNVIKSDVLMEKVIQCDAKKNETLYLRDYGNYLTVIYF